MEEELLWIKEVLSGNKKTYAHIINKYKNPLYATILRMTKNPHDAQDLVQEAFIKVYHQLDKYDKKGSFSSWIYRVTINHCMDEFRKKRYKMKQVEIDEEKVVNASHPEVIFLKNEKSRQLERLIATLPEEERMIILLRYVNEKEAIFMNCPKVDKLSQYVDNLLIEKEQADIQTHIKSCERCMRIVEAFNGEQQFIRETLQTPTLSDDFASIVLEQLEPYEQKKKKKKWKRALLPAAACVLAVGLTANLNPSFADWIGGFFTTEQVDEGLRAASESGRTLRIDQKVIDQGISFKVEDVIADTSRVALSYQVVKGNGKILPPQIDMRDGKNIISAYDQDGNPIEEFGFLMDEDYGLFEFSLRGHESIDSLTIKFELNELNGTKGNWQLEIPIDLKEIKDMTTRHVLEDQNTMDNGVGVLLKEVQFAPSSIELLYDTYFTAEEKAKVEAQIQKLENVVGNMNNFSLTYYDTAIEYHIEDKSGKTLYRVDQSNPIDSGSLCKEPGKLRGSLDI